MAIPLPSDPRKYTDAIEEFVRDLNAAFPAVASMGIYNRRYIGGTTTWSQHAWGNAVDITSPTSVARMADGKIVRDTRNPRHMAYLDTIAAWIRRRGGHRVLLWRTYNHWNHIHMDPYPKQYGTPPLLTGTGETEDDLAFAEYITEQQKSLNDAGYLGENGRPLSVDGVFGPNTAFAMAARDADAAKVKDLAAVGVDLREIRVVRDVDFEVTPDGLVLAKKYVRVAKERQ